MMPTMLKPTGTWGVDTIITFSVCYVHYFNAKQDYKTGFSLHAPFL